MSKNEDMVELISLEKIGKDRWQFRVKPNASFERIFASLVKARVFDISVTFSLIDDTHYKINDEGIWLLSHCFSNWTKMYAEATKKSPWEEAWHKKQQQEEVSEHDKMKCASCGVDGFNDLVFCRECNGWLCSPCYANPTHIHNPAYKEKQKQQKASWLKQACAQCKREYGPAYAWVYCSQCKQQFCLKCSDFHQETHAQTYSARTEYGMPGSINIGDLQEIFRAYAWARSESAEERWAKEEEAARQQAKEQEEHMKEQARKNDEFWHGFFYQNNPFSSQSAGQDDESWTFRQHYTGQQSYSNGYYGFDKQSTPGISKDLHDAFKLFNLSTRATVQEVKRKFRHMAKQGEYRHPDVGGSKEKFVMLNNAYELALAHAERNEVK